MSLVCVCWKAALFAVQYCTDCIYTATTSDNLLMVETTWGVYFINWVSLSASLIFSISSSRLWYHLHALNKVMNPFVNCAVCFCMAFPKRDFFCKCAVLEESTQTCGRVNEDAKWCVQTTTILCCTMKANLVRICKHSLPRVCVHHLFMITKVSWASVSLLWLIRHWLIVLQFSFA